MSEIPRPQGGAPVQAQIETAFAALRQAILDKNEAGLWALHDPDFRATELHGKVMTAAEHISAVMDGGELAMEFSDISVLPLGEVAIAWGAQMLSGLLLPEHIGAAISEKILSGIRFVFTAVWRRSNDGWRILTYHVSIPEPQTETDA